MPEQHEHGDHSGDGTMGVHGMLLFGDDGLYLSHLPMFQSPHNFQVILEVEFDDTSSEALRADRETSSQNLYTFVPVEFPISELDPRGDGPKRSLMDGDIYQGHFERGGHQIAANAVAEVRNIVYFNELDVDARRDANRELTYLCFGSVEHLHLAHEVTANPDFDQVLAARMIPGSVMTQAGRPVGEEVTRRFDFAQPVQVQGRSDTPGARLAPREIAEGSFFATIGPKGFHGFRVQIEVNRELYLELRELGTE